jgi:hypothetical protein
MKVTPDEFPLRQAKVKYRLTPGRVYEVIGIEADDLRIVDDDNEPVLIPSNLLDVVDATEPEDWVTEYGDERERYAYPAEIGEPGFFEDWHDGVPEAVRRFQEFLRRRGIA